MVKCDNLCYKATTFDQMYRYKNDDDLHEGHPKIIKGQIVIMPYGFQTLSEVSLNQIGDNHVFNRGQMLTEVKS